MVGATSPVPTWLQVLMGEKFFCPCHLHDSAKKNRRNIFCLDCCASICLHCLSLPLHESHSYLQIRRYVYRDVIRLDDAQKLLNCSHVQPYIVNSAKVVFLKQRPASGPLKRSGNFCATCDRNLQDSYIFCSLSCKVHNQMTNNFGPKRQNHNHKYKYLYSNSNYLKRYSNSKNKNCNNLEDNHLTTDYAIDSPKLESTISKSTPIVTRSYDRWEATIFKALNNVRGNEFVKKKHTTLLMNQEASKFRYLPDSNITSLKNRRKGIPCRSHLY